MGTESGRSPTPQDQETRARKLQRRGIIVSGAGVIVGAAGQRYGIDIIRWGSLLLSIGGTSAIAVGRYRLGRALGAIEQMRPPQFRPLQQAGGDRSLGQGNGLDHARGTKHRNRRRDQSRPPRHDKGFPPNPSGNDAA